MTVEGKLEVCKGLRQYHVKNLDADWVWYDRIDAKGMKALANNGENWAVIIVEGLFWDKIVDGVLDLDFDVNIHFSDKISSTTFPPGPVRK